MQHVSRQTSLLPFALVLFDEFEGIAGAEGGVAKKNCRWRRNGREITARRRLVESDKSHQARPGLESEGPVRVAAKGDAGQIY